MIIQPTVRDFISVIFRHKRAFSITALACAALGATYLLIATPKYRSEAVLVVRFDEKAIPDTNMAKDSRPEVTASNDRHEIVLAHVDILSSPDLAREVISSIGLDKIYPAIAANPPKIGTEMDAAVARFHKQLLADPEPTGDGINLSFLHPNPVIAQQVMQRLIEGYMQREGALFSASEYGFLKAQTAQAAKSLAGAQQELANYKASAGITSFDDQITETIKQRRDVSLNLQNNEVALEQSLQHRDQLQKLLRNVPASLANSASEKYHSVDDAQSKLADLRDKEKQMLTTYRSDSPMLLSLRASIAAGESDVAKRHGDLASRDATSPNTVFENIQTDLLRATADTNGNQRSVDLLKQQLSGMDSELARLEASRSGLNDRTRAVEIADGAYHAIALHLEDARVAENRLKQGYSHGGVIAAPSLPYVPASPRYKLFAVAFAVASIMAGMAVAFALELADDRFVTVDHVTQALGLQVLAVVERAT